MKKEKVQCFFFFFQMNPQPHSENIFSSQYNTCFFCCFFLFLLKKKEDARRSDVSQIFKAGKKKKHSSDIREFQLTATETLIEAEKEDGEGKYPADSIPFSFNTE